MNRSVKYLPNGINAGYQLDRWNELNEVLRVQTRAEFANILLDSQMKIQAFHQIESTLSDNGVRLVFIGNSTPDQTKEFLEITTVHVCGELYSDPQLGLYKLFDLKRGRIRSLLMPLVSGISKYGMKGVKEGVKLGYETSHLAGDSWQQGGTVILDQEGNIKYVHVEEHPADWPDMKEVLPLVGIQDSSLDYKKAVADWLKAREESS